MYPYPTIRPSYAVLILLLGIWSLQGNAQTVLMQDGVTISECSGIFYDSGGTSGNYGNNEDMTMRICPTGGAGSGPFTSVLFTLWDVAAGTDDSLAIYDGTTTTNLLLVGDGNNDLLNVSVTSTDPSGCLTFRWVSNGSINSSGWSAEITTGPDAGTSDAYTYCTYDNPVSLFTLLGGTPDMGGTWTDPGNNPHSDTFDPATDPAGGYSYTVSGPAPCADSIAVVTITLQTGTNAGIDGNFSTCSDGAPFSLFGLLGGAPQPGGTWRDPSNSVHSETYDPLLDSPGDYTYTVVGVAPCADSVATVSITEVTPSDAGQDAAHAVCSNEGTVSLFTLLGGSPESGGTWTAPGNSPHSGTFDPLVDVSGNYVYTVSSIPPCADATAIVSMTVNQDPDAGGDGTLEVCDDDAPVSLFAQLTGNPNNGGIWLAPGFVPHSATFDPGSDPSGDYTYVVFGTPPCENDSATVAVTVTNAPNAGGNAIFSVCSDDSPVDLFSLLTGNPDVGGTWSHQVNGAHSGTYLPGIDDDGIYTYTVSGTAPCSDDQATVTISETEAPDPGQDGSTTLCSTDPSVNLFSLLNGTPEVGGTWRDPNGVPHSSTFQPSSDLPGTYTYLVLGSSPCSNDSAVVEVNVNQAPDAGSSTTVTLCASDAPMQLVDLLNGTPDPGGIWEHETNGPHGAVFDPAADDPGLYTYTVAGVAPCTSAMASVNITVNQPPDPGTNGSSTICSSDGSFSLFALLGGTPDPGGAWLAPGNIPHSGTYVPNIDDGGVYIYTVLGQSPCANAQSTVTITEIQAPDAGSNASIAVCSNDAPFSLLAVLNGTPDAGGSWVGPGGPHSGTYDPSSDDPGDYTYMVVGVNPCTDATATVQVVEPQAPKAGLDNDTTFCSTDGLVQLIDLLEGTPDAGGTWLDPNEQVFTSTFAPGSDLSGNYTYVVTGAAPCENDSAVVSINVNTAPDAGTNGSLTVCSTDGQVDLFTLLGGTPDGGGQWKDPNGVDHSGLYIPGSSQEGIYRYIVSGAAPCEDAEATVNVTEHLQPYAGTDGSLSVCSDDNLQILLLQLNDNPQTIGVWKDPFGVSHSGLLDPANDPSGVYTYLIQGESPCLPDSAVVSVSITTAPNAGGDGGLTTCSDVNEVDLFTGLVGAYDIGGIWNDDDNTGALSGNLFSPLGLPPDDYQFTYTVSGSGDCNDDEAVVTVTIVSQLDAGINGGTSVCDTETSLALFSVLNGTPQPGGSWEDLDLSGALTGGVFDASVAGAGVYTFKYLLSGSVGCANDSAQVTVTVVQGPDAGDDGSTTVCSDANAINMFNLLGGSPEPGGVWRDEVGVAHSVNYNPSSDDPQTFSYTVGGNAPCENDTAFVIVQEIQAPNSGTSNDTTVCSNGAAFDMLLLLGDADPTGTWMFGVDNHSGTFDPAIDPAGVYQYQVDGVPPCAPSISTVTVSLNQAANAGISSSITICSDEDPFFLIQELGGNPNLNDGYWVGPNGTHTGIFDLDVDGEGEYEYIVPGDAPCDTARASVSVFISEEPDPGLDNTINVCQNGPSFQLFGQLGGTPDANGTWTFEGGFSSGTFTPGISSPGDYVYHVTGLAPCDADSATVTVNLDLEPNPGSSSSHIICDNEPAFELIDLLGGTPDLGGAWSFAGSTHTGFFQPGVSQSGVYTYTVEANGSCSADSATVTILVNAAPFAGSNGSQTLCSSDGVYQLFNALGNGPDLGGDWFTPDTSAHDGTFEPGNDVPGTYLYVVYGVAPCANDTASVEIDVNEQPWAGTNGVVTICDDQLNFNLIDHLGGSPDFGGVWQNPGGGSHSGIFAVGTDTAGIYTYTVSGDSPCLPSEATVNVIVNEAPHAGLGGELEVCSDQDPFSLLDELSNDPDLDGTWYFNGIEHSGTFNPSSDDSGEYLYVVEGDAPCINDSASMIIELYQAPNAGLNNGFPVCTDQSPFNMFDYLGGSPDPGGYWLDPFDAPHDEFFNPGSDPTGAYTYVVMGVNVCENDSAILQLENIPAPEPGVGSTITTCENDPDIDLFQGLSGNPDLDGTWVDVNMTGQLSGSSFDATGLGLGQFEFRYVLDGGVACSPDSSTVFVSLTSQLDAGINDTIQVCDNEIAVDLFSALDGTPQPGGLWVDLSVSGGLDGGILNAEVAGQGTVDLMYILEGSGACVSDTAYLQVNIVLGPNAGESNLMVARCTSDPQFSLIDELGGSPDAGGQWLGPDTLPLVTSNFTPGVDEVGNYFYVVQAQGNCLNDTAIVNVSVTQAPNAGQSASIQSCTNDDPVDLFLELGGNPDGNGSWVDPSLDPHNGIFDPASQEDGLYVYTVQGISPCPGAIASVTVTLDQEVFAGDDADAELCSNDSSVDLYDFLVGADGSGSWLDTAMNAFTGVFLPGTDPDGVYTYVVEGQGACINDTSLVTVMQTDPPNPGIGLTLDTCETTGSLDLFLGIDGPYDTGGIWDDVSGSGALFGNVFNPTLAGAGTYEFDYIVPGTPPCGNESTTVTVNVSVGPDAGIPDTVMVCEDVCDYNLFDALLGTPQSGGTWTDDWGTGTLTDSLVSVCDLIPGSYPFTYGVSGPGCEPAYAQVWIEVETGSNAGEDGSLVLCEDADPVLLINSVGGTPDNGGSWVDENGDPHSGNFDPLVDMSGDYYYIVPSATICGDDTATVSVQLNPLPDAGLPATLEVCDTLTSLDLFSVLNGTPDPGGLFTDDDGTGALDGNIFNPSLAGEGEFEFTYTVSAEGCADDASVVKVEVHGSINAISIEDCDETYRMYTVVIELSGGDADSYVVDGVSGDLVDGDPITFVSDPIPHNQAYQIWAQDQYACNVVSLEGVSPCYFEDEVFVPGSFSPNGDGINETFLIPGIEGFPGNSLIIFNRWGNEVFSATGYDNAGNVWDGSSQNAMFGEELPEGTYFYVLDLNNGREPLSGSVYLNR